MSEAFGNPFLALIVPMSKRLPAVGSVQLVVNGRRLREKQLTRHALNSPALDEEEEAERAAEREALKKARKLAYYKARYQRIKQDPQRWAKRKAQQAASKGRDPAYHARYRAANLERRRAQSAAWERKRRAQMGPKDQALLNERQRDYYYRNREAQIAKMRDYREKNREAINARRRERKAAQRAAAAQGGAA